MRGNIRSPGFIGDSFQPVYGSDFDSKFTNETPDVFGRTCLEVVRKIDGKSMNEIMKDIDDDVDV